MKTFIWSLLVGAMLMAVLVACGGSSTTTSPTPIPPTSVALAPTAAPTATAPATTVTAAPTQPAPIPTAAGSTGSLDEQIAAGKILFEKTAGGVGCALCHGIDGKGDPVYAAPSNRGATADQILDAIETRPQMAFLVLSNDEVQAVAAYLKVLAEQP
jgi:mono/diheme cytochrome c family protein